MIEEEIFHQALARSSPEERAAYLDQACAGDPALRASVEALLRAHAGGSGFLDAPAPAPAATVDEPPVGERPGTVIGPYKLLEQIGEGGMGTVWTAQQTEPVRRLVAMKLIRAGMDSRQVIARFEAERQALALMDHAHIARVLDAGTTSAGRPYFVMDLVKGVPITRYCDEHHLTPRQRLELFIPVCQAIQHAHQKGIIHRDLKPSNVLVALYDGKPVPKVIDFGVAKAAGQQLTDKTLVTGFGALVGTLEYMSPEQAEINQLDIDTRSDIYSLGVLLYELLAGSPPFSRQELEKAGVLEMLRVIREQEPAKPSTKLSTADGLPTLAANRGTEPAKLAKLVRGELDWIVMKALEKDRSRRYETANGFAMDVQRYLADEPVLACPPSGWYRLRKFARRNKRALGTAAVLAVALLAGVGAVAGSLGWAARDRSARQAILDQHIAQAVRDAEASYQRDELAEASAAVKRADGLLTTGQENEELRQQVRRWQAALAMAARLDEIRLEQSAVKDEHFDTGGADPAYREAFQSYGIDVESLEPQQAADRIRASLVQDRLLSALDDWVMVKGIWRLPAKERLLAIAQEVDVDPWRKRFRDAYRRGDTKAVRELARNPEVMNQRPATVLFLANIVYNIPDIDLAIDVLRRAQQRHPGDFWIYHQLGRYLENAKPPGPTGAVGFYRAAAALRPESPGVHINLGNALHREHKSAEAETEFRRAMLLKGDYATAHYNLGNALREQGKFAEAEAEYRTVVQLRPDHFYGHDALALVLLKQGKEPEAEAEIQVAERLKPAGGDFWYSWGVRYAQAKKWDRAAAAFERATAQKPNDHWSWCFRALVNLQMANKDEYRKVCTAMLTRLGNTKDPQTAARVVYTCVVAPYAMPDPARLVPLAELGATAWRGNDRIVAAALYRAGRFEEALRKFTELRTESTNDLWETCFLAMTYHRLGRPEDAGRRLDPLLAWRESLRHLPKDAPPSMPWHTVIDICQLVAEAEEVLGVTQLAPAYAHAERGEWDRAAPEFAQAFASSLPDDSFRWFEYAFVLWQRRDIAGYSNLCARVHARFGESQDYGKIATLAHTCALVPGALDDPAAVVRLAQRRLAASPPDTNHLFWARHVLALARLRAGKYAEVVEGLREERLDGQGEGYHIRNWFILAIAHHRLGHADESRRWFEKADKWIREKDRDRPDKSVRFAPSGFSWSDWLGVQLHRREAEEVLSEKK
jgi:serine/threonine protein kinase/tetratricopeptide (TPR) repeat protein